MSSKNADVVRKVAEHLIKLFKIKSKTMPAMRGGANLVDYLAKSRKKPLEKPHRSLLIKELNRFIRNAKTQQKGSGKVGDWFKNTFDSPSAHRFYKGFAKGFKSVYSPAMRIFEPIASVVAPELGVPLGIANKALGLT